MDNKFNLVVIAPALNEESYIPHLIESVKKQTKKPTEIIVVDNGSTDKTAKVAKNCSCTVLQCRTKGIGPARSIGTDYVLKKYEDSLNRTIIIQLDCDEKIINLNYFAKVTEAYLTDKNLMVTTGPLHYEVMFKNNRKKIIKTGRQFRKIFYIKTLSELFTGTGRDINDYLLPAGNHKLFTGGNTTYRANIFQLNNVSFPQDKSWESIVISVRIQQHISENQIKFIEEQAVATSSRSFTNSKKVINPNRLKSIREKGYIKPFKSKDCISPQQTMTNLIGLIDRETYGLSANEHVEKVISISKSVNLGNKYKTLPMLHASTLKKIQGKYILIKQLSI